MLIRMMVPSWMVPWFSSHLCLPVDVELGPAGADEEDGSLLDDSMVLLPHLPTC